MSISYEDIKADWTARGYSATPIPKYKSYAQGWSRGEHTHPVSLVMTLVTRRMEFIFAG